MTVAVAVLMIATLLTYFTFAGTNFRVYGTTLTVNEEKQTLSFYGESIKNLCN